MNATTQKERQSASPLEEVKLHATHVLFRNHAKRPVTQTSSQNTQFARMQGLHLSGSVFCLRDHSPTTNNTTDGANEYVGFIVTTMHPIPSASIESALNATKHLGRKGWHKTSEDWEADLTRESGFTTMVFE